MGGANLPKADSWGCGGEGSLLGAVSPVTPLEPYHEQDTLPPALPLPPLVPAVAAQAAPLPYSRILSSALEFSSAFFGLRPPAQPWGLNLSTSRFQWVPVGSRSLHRQGVRLCPTQARPVIKVSRTYFSLPSLLLLPSSLPALLPSFLPWNSMESQNRLWEMWHKGKKGGWRSGVVRKAVSSNACFP